MIKIILFFVIMLLTPPITDVERGVIRMEMLPIITIPDIGFIDEDIKIELIAGLFYYDVIWKSDNDINIKTPESLILRFTEPGIYVPYIYNRRVEQYKITVE